MAKIIVKKSNPLNGTVKIDGAKNAVLPIIAATLLAKGKSVIREVPNLRDVHVISDLLRHLGAEVEYEDKTLTVDATNITTCEAPYELVRKMRASFLVMGPLLSRFNHTKISMPGGCAIGTRPIDLHLKGFQKLGINIEEVSGDIKCSCDKIVGNTINLDFPSVGATENIILASVLAEGETLICNAAQEPEIVDLQNILNKMGAKVSGAGTNNVKVIGVKQLKQVSYNVMPDRIEAGTLLCATAITGGNIKLNNVMPDHLLPVLHKLEETGCKVQTGKNYINLVAPKRLKAVDIKTMPYPGFPTDMQSIFGSILTVSKGTSIVIENIFENRFKYTNELNRMGAKITIEGKMAVIKGVRKLSHANVESTDLRGGAALVVAGLVAKGTTKVSNIEYILRGYEDLDKKLNSIGANIMRVND